MSDRAEKRRQYQRAYHERHPEVDAVKQKVRTRAEHEMRQKYQREYAKLVKTLGYEGVKGNARYVQAVRILKQRHPKVWAQLRTEARSAIVAESSEESHG